MTTALVLSKHKNLSITLVSKHMPGDYDIEYASPWAGANFMPVGSEGSKLRAFEKATCPDPSTFDDPTIYHIRDPNATTTEEEMILKHSS